MKPHRDLYQETTDRIIASIEAGATDWRMPWAQMGLAPTRSTGEHYRGVNVLLLGMASAAGGYTNPHWLTFKQAKALGGSVRKGEKGTGIVFFKALTKDAPEDPRADDNGEVTIPCLRGYTVFNVEQVDGLPDGKFPAPAPIADDKARDMASEAAMRSCGATITERGGAAFYDRNADAVTLPPFAAFHSTAGYLATMAHELAHWTGAPHRLDRTKGKRFGDKNYAFEELVAELAASFIGARLGFTGDHFESHAAYLASWLKGLREDKKAIFRAAALAQAAADMVLANAGAGPDPEPVKAPACAPVRPRATATRNADAQQPAQLALL